MGPWTGRTPNADEWRELLERHARWLTGKDGTRADLTGADLARAYLARADLAGADLTGANLTGANLAGANLTGANLAGAYLAGADLTGAYLAGADLAGADLTGADLTGADLARADLTGAHLADIRIPKGARILQIGPIGSRASIATIVLHPSGIWVQTGCYAATLEVFEARVKAIHRDNRYAHDYAALCEFARRMSAEL